MKQYDDIVAGAGIWGCTVARRLAEAGRRVLVLEKRPVIGGNCRCETDPETGIEIHSYGSHIFHTHNKDVWDFVRRFTDFNGYQHKVLASTRALPPDADERLKAKVEGEGGRIYHLPLGLTLVNKFFDVELKPSEVKDFMADEAHSSALFDAFFRGYTSKQWGTAPEEIDPGIIKRVPVRSNYDTNYYNDYWQGIPSDGYNALFERLLDHPNITVQCNCDFALDGDGPKVKGEGEGGVELGNDQTIYYSGPIDELFGYRFGALPWRTLRFETERLSVKDYQGTAVMNYPEITVPYTRVHEFKHYHPEGRGRVEGERPTWGFDAEQTVIMREYSKTWEMGDEPYYPINNPESAALLKKYQDAASTLNAQLSTRNIKLVIGGRLGLYKYFDMDQAMAEALKVGC